LKEFGVLRDLLAAAVISACVFSANASGAARQIETTGDPQLDGILSNVTWDANELTFAFPEDPLKLQPKDIKFKPLPDEQRAIIRSVFKNVETVTSLHFTEINRADDAQLTFARWDQPSLLGRVNALFQSPAGGWVNTKGQTWISADDATLTDASAGSYPTYWWMHEIGHIAGLEHTHYNFARKPLPLELDLISNTIMSYRLSKGHILDFPRGNVFSTTYMPLDIFALQHLYGANWETNAGDTVFRFTPDSGDYLAGDAELKGNPTGKLFLTLWDGGGNDTLDFSAYAQDGVFDLRPGAFSTPSPMQRVSFKAGVLAEGSIAMPFLPNGDDRALIENIIVGSGNNFIVANEAVNQITLGEGMNKISFHPGSHKDTIVGFGEDDTIDLSGYDVPAEMIHTSTQGEDTVITIDQWGDDEIRIVGFIASLRYLLR
jgi:serralysin